VLKRCDALAKVPVPRPASVSGFSNSQSQGQKSTIKVSNFRHAPRQFEGESFAVDKLLARCEGQDAAAGIIAEADVPDIAPALHQIAVMAG
jgi:hypothetical protein